MKKFESDLDYEEAVDISNEIQQLQKKQQLQEISRLIMNAHDRIQDDRLRDADDLIQEVICILEEN